MGLLVFLMAMHLVMENHLDRQGVKDFKPSHRLYLMVSTVQWAANLGVLGLTIRLWTDWNRSDHPPPMSGGSTLRLR